MDGIKCTECGKIVECSNPRKCKAWCDICDRDTDWKEINPKKVMKAAQAQEKQLTFFRFPPG